jgi:hypothetical protein
MAGRRMVTKFVIENIGVFKKALPNPKKYLLIYVEPLDLTEESLAGYLRLMGLSFIDVCRQNPKCSSLVDKEEEFFSDESIGYARLLGKLKELVKKAISQGFRGFEVVFFLGEFDELTFANKIFYNNLKSLWSSLSPSLHFVFLMRENITESHLIKKFCELAETILQNVVFVPLLTKEDIEHLIALNEKRLRISFAPSEKKTMTKVCGTHPFLLKTACRITAKTREKTSKNGLEKVLARNYELKSAASVMWEV